MKRTATTDAARPGDESSPGAPWPAPSTDRGAGHRGAKRSHDSGEVPRHLSFAEASRAVRTRQRLLESGMIPRAIARAVASGEHRRLQRNRYVSNDLWADLWPESRHLLEVCAAAGEMRDGGAVASYESAGVLHELPLYRHVPAAVHVTTPPGSRMSSRHGLTRHSDLLPDKDIDVLFGIRCATLDRTVFDLVRTLGVEAALAVADAALRQVAMVEKAYGEVAAEGWRQRMLERCARSRGVRGIRQAETVIRLADGRAESSGESVSRLQLRRLGFRRLRLQAAVAGPHGRE